MTAAGERTIGALRRVASTVAIVLLAGHGLTAAEDSAGNDPTLGRGQIRGEITGVDGMPLVGISIILAPSTNAHVIYATSTDDRGRYALNALLPDTYQVRADGQGFVSLIKEPISVNPPFRAIIDLEMEASNEVPAPAVAGEETGTIAHLEGRFLDDEGQPVIEGSVIFQRIGHPEDLFYGRTDASGRFVLEDLPAGIYDIASRSPGLIPLHLNHHPLPAAETIHLHLVAPPYPLSFRGWLDDLLPTEVPVRPPELRAIEWDSEDSSPES